MALIEDCIIHFTESIEFNKVYFPFTFLGLPARANPRLPPTGISLLEILGKKDSIMEKALPYFPGRTSPTKST